MLPTNANTVRDALTTARSVLREAALLGIERVAGVGASDIPVDTTAVTPAWLTRALQRRFRGVRVAALEPLGDTHGTTSRARFRVAYDAAGNGADPPNSIFLKLAPGAFATRLFVNVMRLGWTEVRFYQTLAPHVPIVLPQALAAECAGRSQRFAIVFEDLTASGVRFMNVSEHVSLDDARTVMQALARLHAHFWSAPEFHTDWVWLKSRDRNPNYAVERLVCAMAVKPALRRFADLVPAELRDAAPRIIACRDHLEDAWAAPPLTLVHGDAHVGNLYFTDTDVGFLDWQVVQRGQGMRDVSYFLINSVPTDVRRAHQRSLIESYLTTLAAHGVSRPDFEVAWHQYRLHAFYAWIAAVVTAAAGRLQEEAIVRAGLTRSSNALLDLESLATLDQLCT